MLATNPQQYGKKIIYNKEKSQEDRKSLSMYALKHRASKCDNNNNKKPVTVVKGKIDMPTVTVSLTALLVIDKTPGSQQ